MKHRALAPVALLLCLSGCASASADADAQWNPPTGSSVISADPSAGIDASPSSSPSPAAQQQASTKITLPTALRYLQSGYNGIGEPNRVAVAVAPNGTGQLAWSAPDGVHVTPLDTNLARAGADVVIGDAAEVSGLVAHNDGFAVLTRRPDTNKWNETAAYLVRYAGGQRTFAVALTGAKSPRAGQDTAPVLGCQLAWNGSKYGAYFIVHGAGGFADGHFGDKLVYVNDSGKLLDGGWDWGCSHNEGIALLPTGSGPFASLRLEDWRSGLFISTGIGAPNEAPVISREECWAGYCGGDFGGFASSPSGQYAVAFSSRGAASAIKNPEDSSGRGWKVEPRWKTHQVAVAFLSSPSKIAVKPVYLTGEAGTDHVNVRVAAYGADKFLVTWEAYTGAKCSAGTCTGTFAGTMMQVVDGSGAKIGAARPLDSPLSGDITVAADGSLVFASAGQPKRTGSLGSSPTTNTITVVRLRPWPV